MRMTSRMLRLTALLAAVSSTGGMVSAAEPARHRSAEQRQIDALTQQLQEVQAQLRELTDQNRQLLQKEQQLEQQVARATQPAVAGATAAVASNTGPTNSAVPSATSNPVPPSAGNPVPPPSSNPIPPGVSNPVPPGSNATPPVQAADNAASLFGGVKLWGYGELYYTHPTHDNTRSQADLARAVFGIGYTFNSRTEFNSEFEVEHAVASADDPGEFEVEQFYVDRQLNDAMALRAGLFLMPFGFLNEHHEPTNFFGVQRNFVETLIIPSTWREGGLNLHGDTPFGLSWNVGLTTGFDLSKWDFAPEFPLYTTALDLEGSDAGPLKATHQELARANAQHLSQYLALGYFGIPGLSLGAAVSTGEAASADNSRVTLWEGHARWTPGKFDLAALYARGTISNLAATNAANPGSPNPIPSEFYGYYFQGAYTVWERDDYRLTPFARWEYYNMGARYEGTPGPALPAGPVPLSDSPGDYGSWPSFRDRVFTVGANFYVTPHVVFKLDYQWFDMNSDFTRLDLGLGVAF
jgi:Phosphate-selective porin O and P